jgi:hypothetical protein
VACDARNSLEYGSKVSFISDQLVLETLSDCFHREYSNLNVLVFEAFEEL